MNIFVRKCTGKNQSKKGIFKGLFSLMLDYRQKLHSIVNMAELSFWGPLVAESMRPMGPEV